MRISEGSKLRSLLLQKIAKKQNFSINLIATKQNLVYNMPILDTALVNLPQTHISLIHSNFNKYQICARHISSLMHMNMKKAQCLSSMSLQFTGEREQGKSAWRFTVYKMLLHICNRSHVTRGCSAQRRETGGGEWWRNQFELGKGKRIFQGDKTVWAKIREAGKCRGCLGDSKEKLEDMAEGVCSEQEKSWLAS